MNRQDMIEKLQALTRRTDNRSKAAQLRDMMDGIEAALSRGVSRKAIVEELAQNGLVMPLATFDSIVRRHRKKHAPPSGTARNHTPSSTGSTMTAEEAEHPMSGTSSPATLDNIINNTPDLAGYARMAKENKRSKKS